MPQQHPCDHLKHPSNHFFFLFTLSTPLKLSFECSYFLLLASSVNFLQEMQIWFAYWKILLHFQSHARSKSFNLASIFSFHGVKNLIWCWPTPVVFTNKCACRFIKDHISLYYRSQHWLLSQYKPVFVLVKDGAFSSSFWFCNIFVCQNNWPSEYLQCG